MIRRATCILFILLLINPGSRGQEITWSTGRESLAVIPVSGYLRDTDGRLQFGEVKNNVAGFKPFGKTVLSAGFDESWYWLRFRLNNTGSDSLLLVFEHAFIPLIELYYTDNSGNPVKMTSGYNIPLAKKPFSDHFQVFPLPSGDHEFFVKIQPLVHATPVYIRKLSDWQLQSAKRNMVYGIFAGILFLVVLINFYLFIVFRKRYYLYYSLLLLLYICTSAFVMEGYGIYLFPGADLMFWYKMIPAMDMPALLAYAISFLGLKQYSYRLWRFSIGVLLFFFLHLLALPFIPLMPALLINQVFAMGVFILASAIGIITGKKGNRLGYYFSMAYFVWFVLILLEAIFIQTGNPAHFSDLSYVSFAVFTEALLLALLLVIRFQWDKKADLAKQTELENELLNARLEIQEQTFQHISQEIHDNIGQSLILAKLNIGKARDKANDDEKERLQSSHILISDAIQQLRDLSKSFNTNYIQETGLARAIEQQLQILRKTDAFTIEYADKTADIRLSPKSELLIYRVVQELLNNIMKHAGANHIIIELNQEEQDLLISVSDNGVGFDVESRQKDPAKGLGLRNMAHRLNLINGKMSISSQPGKGTTTILTIHTQPEAK